MSMSIVHISKTSIMNAPSLLSILFMKVEHYDEYPSDRSLLMYNPNFSPHPIAIPSKSQSIMSSFY